jgi:transglutaminase-like putative cysteine protease
LAAFDDVSLTWSEEKLDLADAVLAETHGKYFVVPGGGSPSITLSIPFPFGGQTPLALWVESEPPDAVARLEVKKDRDNRPLRVVLRPQLGKGKVRLRVNTLTLLRDRPISGADGVRLAAGKVPEEAKVHLRAARGVDSGDPRIREIAAKFSRKDAGALIDDLSAFLKEKLKYEGGGDQGARSCIRTGQAVCTGYANTAAALLIAAGMPARVLACTPLEGKTQEHYIVEAWAPGPGWLRIETTMAAFPWSDSKNLILRIIYPDAPRSPANVPLFFELAGAAGGGFDGDPGDGCWQSADTHARLLLDRAELDAIEKAARRGFEACAAKPVPGSRTRFLPPAEKIDGLRERGRRLLEEVDRRAGR